ncbi:MAG TPA: aminotransferase class V-fold PLP-dependent enzyme [Vicinamibacteria bacterium]|nr:aminotransferase class V-fold PLP-dependent enzyme [Vicinamibacteria bacterium]
MRIDPQTALRALEERMERSRREEEGFSRRGFLGSVLGGAAGLSLVAGSTSAAAALESVLPPPLDGGAMPDDERYWNLVANQFFLRRGLAYMNTGTRGPSPHPIHMAQVQALEGINADYNGYNKTVYDDDRKTEMREKLAAFVGAKPNEIAYSLNTSDGMVAGTFAPVLKAGDEIVYTNHDHSGGAYPVLHRAMHDNLEVGVIDLSANEFHPPRSTDAILDAFASVITSRTKLLSFCHINYTDGCVLPVKQICEMARARGILTLVDGAQPPGMMKLDMHDLGCDMYAGPFHKWMMASMQTGFFFVREGVQERLRNLFTTAPADSRSMYGTPLPEERVKTLQTAEAFEPRGSHNIPARVSMDAAIDFHNMLTREAVEARDRYLAQKVHKALRAMDGVDVLTSDAPELGCALVAFTIRGVETRDLNDIMWDRYNIYIRNVTHLEIDWDVNRVSLHVMVTDEHVDRFLGAVEEVAKEVKV